MTALLSVAAGGAIGSVARYLVVAHMSRWLGVAFPWGTLCVNVIGGLVIGILVESMALRWSPPADIKLLLITGVLGGFTTFSAFSLEVVALAERGAIMAVAAYVVASIVLSVCAVVLGMALIRGMLG